MGEVKDLMHLGLLMSLVPEGESLRDFVFEDKVTPSHIQSLSSDLKSPICFRFEFRSGTGRSRYLAVWDPEKNEVTYHLNRRRGNSRSSNRMLDGMSWLIDVRTCLKDDKWSYQDSSRMESIGRTVRTSWHHYWKSWQEFRSDTDAP